MGAFWDAWNKQGEVNQRGALASLQQAQAVQGILAQQQQMATQQQQQELRAQMLMQERRVQGILSDPALSPQDRERALISLGKPGLDAASALGGLEDKKAIALERIARGKREEQQTLDAQRKAEAERQQQGALAQLNQLMQPKPAVPAVMGNVSPTGMMGGFQSGEAEDAGPQGVIRPALPMSRPLMGTGNSVKDDAMGLAALEANPNSRFHVIDPMEQRRLAMLADPKAGIAALLKPAGSDSYTLTPGAKRFDSMGREIASTPFAPPNPNAGGFTIGATRYNASGTPIVTGTPNPSSSGLVAVPDPANPGKFVWGPKTAGAEAPGPKGNDTTGELSKQAIDNIATELLYDPKAAVGLNRDTKTKKLIENRRAEIMAEAGITSHDMASGRAGVKADQVSLSKIVPQYDAVTAFENNTKKQGERLLALAAKLDSETGMPIIDKWVRAGRQAVSGDVDVSNFNAQMTIYRTEAARILFNPNLTGVLTDNARHEAENMIKPGATPEQIIGAVTLLANDFDIRKVTMEAQINAIKNRLKGRMIGADSEQRNAGAMLPGGVPVPGSRGAAPDLGKGLWK